MKQLNISIFSTLLTSLAFTPISAIHHPGSSSLLSSNKYLHISRGGGGGGSTKTLSKNQGVNDNEHDDQEEEMEELEKQQKIQELIKKQDALRKYKLEQQHLLQLRSTFFSEALASRGILIGPTMMDVSTPEGSKPPQECDWDCCLSTDDDPKTCLYSFDAEPNTKVVAPLGTTQYISLSALNRLRRNDPTKVEPMWHSQYSILKSWFSDDSPYSLLQFVGLKGFLVSTVLLDFGRGAILRSLLILSVVSAIFMLMPILEYIVGKLLVSSTFWMKWHSWGRFAHAALPLKILLGQMTWKFVAGSFAKLEGIVKDYIVDLECSILEECIPITVGVADDNDLLETESDDDDVIDMGNDDINIDLVEMDLDSEYDSHNESDVEMDFEEDSSGCDDDN